MTGLDVHCLLGVARGSSKLVTLDVLGTAYGYLDILRACLRPPNHQPGGVARAAITEQHALILRNEAARMVMVRYVVHIKVWSL